MKLSILLVCYNQEKYINQCIDSILLQQIPFDYEIIVADDFSTDTTLAIIKNRFSKENVAVNFLDNMKNIGISKNYQRGFAACKGEYIAVMEGDDYWVNPDRLLIHLNFLDKHRECVMSMNRYIYLNQSISEFFHDAWSPVLDYKYISTRDMVAGNKLGNLSACVFRKSEIDKIKPDFYDLNIADWILGLVLSQYGYIAILKDLLSVYRVHENGEWSKMSVKEKRVNRIACIDTYNKYLDYKFDKEFTIYKNKINNETNIKATSSHFVDFIPPIILHGFKLLLPKVLQVYLKKIIYKISKHAC